MPMDATIMAWHGWLAMPSPTVFAMRIGIAVVIMAVTVSGIDIVRMASATDTAGRTKDNVYVCRAAIPSAPYRGAAASFLDISFGMKLLMAALASGREEISGAITRLLSARPMTGLSLCARQAATTFTLFRLFCIIVWMGETLPRE